MNSSIYLLLLIALSNLIYNTVNCDNSKQNHVIVKRRARINVQAPEWWNEWWIKYIRDAPDPTVRPLLSAGNSLELDYVQRPETDEEYDNAQRDNFIPIRPLPRPAPRPVARQPAVIPRPVQRPRPVQIIAPDDEIDEDQPLRPVQVVTRPPLRQTVRPQIVTRPMPIPTVNTKRPFLQPQPRPTVRQPITPQPVTRPVVRVQPRPQQTFDTKSAKRPQPSSVTQPLPFNVRPTQTPRPRPVTIRVQPAPRPTIQLRPAPAPIDEDEEEPEEIIATQRPTSRPISVQQPAQRPTVAPRPQVRVTQPPRIIPITQPRPVIQPAVKGRPQQPRPVTPTVRLPSFEVRPTQAPRPRPVTTRVQPAPRPTIVVRPAPAPIDEDEEEPEEIIVTQRPTSRPRPIQVSVRPVPPRPQPVQVTRQRPTTQPPRIIPVVQPRPVIQPAVKGRPQQPRPVTPTVRLPSFEVRPTQTPRPRPVVTRIEPARRPSVTISPVPAPIDEDEEEPEEVLVTQRPAPRPSPRPITQPPRIIPITQPRPVIQPAVKGRPQQPRPVTPTVRLPSFEVRPTQAPRPRPVTTRVQPAPRPTIVVRPAPAPIDEDEEEPEEIIVTERPTSRPISVQQPAQRPTVSPRPQVRVTQPARIIPTVQPRPVIQPAVKGRPRPINGQRTPFSPRPIAVVRQPVPTTTRQPDYDDEEEITVQPAPQPSFRPRPQLPTTRQPARVIVTQPATPRPPVKGIPTRPRITVTTRPVTRPPTRRPAVVIPEEIPEEDEETVQPTARPTLRPTQRVRPTMIPLTIRTIPTARPTLPARPLITSRPITTTTISEDDENEPDTQPPRRVIITTPTPPIKGRPRPQTVTFRPQFQTIVTSRPTQTRTIPTRQPVTRITTLSTFDEEEEEFDVTTRTTIRPAPLPVTTRVSTRPQLRPAPLPVVVNRPRTTTQSPLDEDDEEDIVDEPKPVRIQPRPQLPQPQRPATRQPAVTLPQFGQRITRPTVSGVKTGQQSTFRPQPTTTPAPSVFEEDETERPIQSFVTSRPTIRTTTNRPQTIRTRPGVVVSIQTTTPLIDYDDYSTNPPAPRPRPVQTARPSLAPRPTLPAVRQPTRSPAPVIQTLPPIVQVDDRRTTSSRPILPLQPQRPSSTISTDDEEKDEDESDISVPEFQPTRRPVVPNQQGGPRQPRPLEIIDLTTIKPSVQPRPQAVELPIQRPTIGPSRNNQIENLPRLPSGKQAIPRRPGSKSLSNVRLGNYQPPLGRPQAINRPDRPLEDGSMPECTLLGQNYCILTKDYPMENINDVVNRSYHRIKLMYEELQTVGDPDLFKNHVGNSRAAKGQFACETESSMMKPGWARDEITKEWMIIVNTDLFPQQVRTESCKRPNEPCDFVAPYYESTCQQRFSLHRLIAVDPHDTTKSPVVALFKFPAGCSCRVHPVRINNNSNNNNNGQNDDTKKK